MIFNIYIVFRQNKQQNIQNKTTKESRYVSPNAMAVVRDNVICSEASSVIMFYMRSLLSVKPQTMRTEIEAKMGDDVSKRPQIEKSVI